MSDYVHVLLKRLYEFMAKKHREHADEIFTDEYAWGCIEEFKKEQLKFYGCDVDKFIRIDSLIRIGPIATFQIYKVPDTEEIEVNMEVEC